MDEFKVKIFEKDYPNEKLKFSNLNLEDSRWVIKKILELSNSPVLIDNTQLFYNSIVDLLQNEIIYNEEVSEDFLKSVLAGLEISNDSICFIFWDFENQIDLLTVENLLNQWDYIWYDSSDEAIILYFPSKDNLVLITDRGFIKTS